MPAPSEWPQLTVISGPSGAGKTHLARTHTRPDRSVWLSLRDQHDGTELAPRLVRWLRSRVPTLPSWLSAATTPTDGPVSYGDPLRRVEQLGSLIGHELAIAMHRPMTLVLDDVDRIDDDAHSMRLIEFLVRTAPDAMSIVMCTRTAVPFAIRRLRSDDLVREISADEFGLDDDEASSLLEARWPWLIDVDELVDLCRGQPGAVLAVGSLVACVEPDRRGPILAELSGSDPTTLAVDATREHYALLDRRHRELVDDIHVLGRATLGDLEPIGHPRAVELIPDLIAAAMVEREPGSDDRIRLSTLAVDVVEPDPERAATLAVDAVRASIGRGEPRAALATARRYGSRELLHDTVARFGAAAIDAGSGRLVLDAIDDLGSPPELRGIAGRAAHALGDRDRATKAYEQAAQINVRPSDAWRHGLIEHFRGDLGTAAAVYRRGIDAAKPDDEPADTARLLGYAGSIAWLLGDYDTARDHARRALELATVAADDASLAVAYTLAAMVAGSDGDRVSNDWHYVRALQHAEREGDVLQIARIRSNRGSRLLEEGEYGAALDELDDAVRYAEVGGYETMLGLALTNRGHVSIKLGRLDDAHADLTTAAELLQRQGTAIVGYALAQLARLFTIRGELEHARGAGEQALALNEPSSDRQIEVAALNQLATALMRLEPDTAWAYAQRAAAVASGSLIEAETWATVARLALARGDRDECMRASTTAIEYARSRHDRYALALALEARAGALADPSEQRRCLDEAFTLFEELGCPIEAGRVEITLAAERADAHAVTRIAAIADHARRLGARPLLAYADEVVERHHSHTATPLAVTALGAFSVSIRGETIPTKRWQSRKARDLFKMLVTLRGRPMTRDLAMERLWPADDPSKASSKLSVALATIRSVLDPDKEFPADHYVRSESDVIVVETSTVPTDVDRFLRAARSALEATGRTRSERTVALLTDAEAQYTGDLFEDDPYVDWHVPLREEARAVYLNVTRELAALRAASGALDDAIRLNLRILEREPYDERAHLDLIAALTNVGRHGDARRRYQQYAERMRELDLEPRSLSVAVYAERGSVRGHKNLPTSRNVR